MQTPYDMLNVIKSNIYNKKLVKKLSCEIRIFIGKTRLNALRSQGFVKTYLHRQANELENKLDEILNNNR